eukprot:s1208_g6.t1
MFPRRGQESRAFSKEPRDTRPQELHKRPQISDLNGKHSSQLGGTLTSVTFDLELLIGEASKYGIRRCRLALLRNTHVLTEEWFDVSSKVPLRFYISSSCFDKSSAYTVAVLWLRPTEPAVGRHFYIGSVSP